MSITRTRASRGTLVLALVAATLTAAPGAARAQLIGRMKKAAQDRVAERIGAPGSKPDTPAGAHASSRLEITPERVDAFVVAMRPLVTDAERRHAERAARAAYDEKRKRWEECGERVGRRLTAAQRQQAAMPSMETQLKMAELATLATPVMEAYLQAAAAGRHERASVLEDSLAVLDFRSKVLTFPPLAECGPPPKRPAIAADAAGETGGATIAQPAGMSATQFGLLRERIAVYLLTRGTENPFTPAERSALDARMTELQTLTAFFRDGTLAWSSWSDLGEAWNRSSQQH